MIKGVEFPSEGATLRGLLFLPDSQAKGLPVVIMAHGFSATVTMVADKFAAAFCQAGIRTHSRVQAVVRHCRGAFRPAQLSKRANR